MDYEICFLVCGNRASALGLQKAVGCFLCEESELFLRASERTHARAHAGHTVTRARVTRRTLRRSHTRFCFCTAITDIIPYYKGYKGQESGGLLHGSSKLFILSILHSGVFHSFIWRYLWPSIWESPKTAY